MIPTEEETDQAGVRFSEHLGRMHDCWALAQQELDIIRAFAEQPGEEPGLLRGTVRLNGRIDALHFLLDRLIDDHEKITGYVVPITVKCEETRLDG